MGFNKKGSLSLSINAIVILVLAISMLGLGLGFTKSMFAKFGSKLDVPPPDIPATEGDPIVTVSDEFQIKKNVDYVMTMNIFNAYGTATVTPAIKCGATSMATGTGQSITGGTYKSFKVIMSALAGQPMASKTVGTTEVCIIEAAIGSSTVSKQITIKWL